MAQLFSVVLIDIIFDIACKLELADVPMLSNGGAGETMMPLAAAACCICLVLHLKIKTVTRRNLKFTIILNVFSPLPSPRANSGPHLAILSCAVRDVAC